MSNQEMKALFDRTKEFVKDKNIKVITPCQVRTNSPIIPVTREVPTVVIIDYLSTLGTH